MRVESDEARTPRDSDLSVVFRGDGEPKTTKGVLERLADFEARYGLEADSFSVGGTIERLELRFAETLGKEAAIFMPTGTLANHLTLRKLCGLNPRAVVQEQSHLYNDTGDCATKLSGINLIPLAKGRPYFTLEEVKEAVDRSETGRVANPMGAVMIESPVRRQAGQIAPFDAMKRITSFSREKGISTHLDGARLYMMSAATGIKPREYTGLFDTVYVSLYKYFGATFGAILAGTTEFVDGLYHDRRMFGGGLSSAYMQAALALMGSEGFEERFEAAMAKASDLFSRINELDGIEIGRFEHGSNIFPVKLDPGLDVGRFTSTLHRHWVFVYAEGDSDLLHLTVNTTVLRQSNDVLLEAFRDALGKSR